MSWIFYFTYYLPCRDVSVCSVYFAYIDVLACGKLQYVESIKICKISVSVLGIARA